MRIHSAKNKKRLSRLSTVHRPLSTKDVKSPSIQTFKHQSIVFDQFAKDYDIGHTKAVSASGFTPAYFHEYKAIELYEYLKSRGKEKEKLTLLDFGCGTGNAEKYLKKHLPNLIISACDISPESVKVAEKENQSLQDIVYKPFDGLNIPFEQTFDIVYIANVFHHIPRRLQQEAMKNIAAKLKDSGFLMMFELNPLNPLTMWVAIQNDYKFDKESKLLNPLYTRRLLKRNGLSKAEIRFTVFFPSFLSFLKKSEKFLRWLPLGAQYYYLAKKR